jgi:dienelactone hydrolase
MLCKTPISNRIRLLLWFAAIVVTSCAASTALADSVNWVPTDLLPPAPTNGPALCPGNYLKPEQGKAVLDAALARFSNHDSWDAYAQRVRQRIQEGAGLSPWPRRTPLNAIITDRRTYDGYSVENVGLETVHGFFATGNLYRPLNPKAPIAVMLSTHGHSKTLDARFSSGMQARCGTLARMGAVVLSIDMFGYGDSIPQVGTNAHNRPFSMTIQTWDNLRAIDFLLSLPDADKTRVGISGESGGGTQTFIATALDPRITLSVPVVMVSSYFFGGCQCESGLPIHRSADHFVNNAMIAALAAPRPMLVVSDGADWTKNVPQVEFPFLQKIYAYYDAQDDVANVHLPNEKHDYGPSKRNAMYHFVAQRFGLNLAAVEDANGKVDESKVAIEKPELMHVFNEAHPPPARALHSADSVEQSLQALQK